MNEILTKKDRVSYLLNRFPETRNSDKALWLEYLHVFMSIDTQNTSLDVAAYSELPTQMALARVRAELQNKYGLYLPTRPDVIMQRQKRRRAYENVFQRLDLLDDSVTNETSFYSDESGLTSRYLLFGFFLTLDGKDSFRFYNRVFEEFPVSERKRYFHFTGLQRRELEDYFKFFLLAVEQASARIYIHIFRRDDLRGREKEILLSTYGISAVETIRDLQGQGLIDENHRIKLIPDESQDQAFYRELEQNIEPRLLERRIRFEGVSDVNSKESYPVQVADVITGAFSRKINAPGQNHKDDLADKILSFWTVGDPLADFRNGILTVINHDAA